MGRCVRHAHGTASAAQSVEGGAPLETPTGIPSGDLYVCPLASSRFPPDYRSSFVCTWHVFVGMKAGVGCMCVYTQLDS